MSTTDPSTCSVLASYLGQVERRDHVGCPSTHENGFVQVPIGDFARLHVWPDGGVRKQVSDSPIHDHSFSLRSWVLHGRLENHLYAVQESALPHGRQYEVHHVSREGKLVPSDVFASVFPLSRQSMVPGSTYEVRSGFFHETRWEGLTVTLMVKTGVGEQSRARVLCPVGQVVDNEFDRAEANPEADLWALVDRAVDLARRSLHAWQ